MKKKLKEIDHIKNLQLCGIYPKIYVDMDGVLANFELGASEAGLPPKEFKLMRGAYLKLKPYKHAFEILDALEEQLGVEIYLLTKIPDENPYSATEKLLWLREVDEKRAVKVTITPDKGSVGNKYDYLLEDRPHKANVKNFKGKLFVIDHEEPEKNLKALVDYFGIEYHFDE